MNTLLGFGILILLIINIIIYHKIFDVVYFDFAKGCSTEIFWIAILTAFEIAIIKGIGQKILGMLGTLFGFVVKLILLVIIISVVIFVVLKIVQMVKGKTDIEEFNKTDNSFERNSQAMDEKKEAGNGAQDFEVMDINIEIKEDGKEVDIESAEAKEFVDSSTKILKKASKEVADNVKTKLEAERAKMILKSSQEPKTMLERQNNIHMVACNSCGKMINEEAKFCNFCGSKVIKIDMTVCVNCGKQITADANFCHYCGEKIKKGQMT